MAKELRYYQREAIEAILSWWDNIHNRALCSMFVGTGKAQPENEPVLTPSGWVTMQDLEVGDFVIGSEGNPVKIMGIFPQGNRPTYRVTFTDGTSTRCDKDHLWSVRYPLGDESSPFKSRFFVKSLTEIIEQGYTFANGAPKFYLPLVHPVEFHTRPISLHPYILGILIGDGGITTGGIRLSTKDQEIIDRVSKLLPEGITLKKIPGDNCDYTISQGNTGCRGGPIGNALRSLGLLGKKSEDKFIPELYKYNSFEVRKELLKGLMDADGCVNKSGSAEFSTTSRQLAEDVCEIARSMGGCTRVREKAPGKYTYNNEKRTGLKSYHVRINLPLNPFELSRKANIYKSNTIQGRTKAIKTIEYIGEIPNICIMVDAPNHLYVTKDYIVTHNTYMFVKLVRHLYAHHSQTLRVIVLAHRQELINQPRKAFVEEFKKEILERSIKVGMVGGFGGRTHTDYNANIICASIQSLVRNGAPSDHLLNILKSGPIQYIIYDEVHHCEAPTFKIPVETMEERARDAGMILKLLGVTATPERGDGLSLGQTFPAIKERDEFTYYYPYKKARADKVVCPVDPYVMETGIDLSGIRLNKHGEVSEKRFTELWEAGNWADLMIEGWRQRGGQEIPTVAFMPSVEISASFIKHLGEKHGIEGGHISAPGEAKTKGCWRWSNVTQQMIRVERSELLKLYEQGKINFISNVNILTEGWDAPRTKLLLLCRPTESPGTYIQMVGRATRPWPGPYVNGERAILLHVGFEGHHFVETNSIGDVVPQEAKEEVEELLDKISIAQPATIVCNECGNPLQPDPNRKLHLWCSHCQMSFGPKGTNPDDFLDLIDTSKPSGKGVHFRSIELMAKAKVQWIKEKGIMSVYLGVAGAEDKLPGEFGKFRLDLGQRRFLACKAERSLVIIAPGHCPKVGDEGFALIGVYRTVKSSTYIRTGQFGGYHKYEFHPYDYEVLKIGELDTVLDRSDMIINELHDPLLSEKDKGWRAEPATTKQIEALRTVGYEPVPGIKKGDASNIQSFKYAQFYLRRKGVID